MRERIRRVCSDLGEYGQWARDSFIDRDNPNAEPFDYDDLTEEELAVIIGSGRIAYFFRGLHEELGEVLEKTEGLARRAYYRAG